MIYLLIMVIVVLLGAWLISLVAQFKREVAAARRRGQLAVDKEKRLKQMIESMLAEESSLEQRIEEKRRANADMEKKLEMVRTEASATVALGRSRLLVLQVRRSPGDKDWIVTMINPLYLKHDPAHPLAHEWASGRDYLVFAKNEQDARDRAQRRFANKPGVTVKGVVAAMPDLYQG